MNEKIKITLAITLAALLVAGTASFFSFGAETEKCTIFVDSDMQSAKPEDRVKISLVLEPGAHIGALTVDLLYDAEYFEYQNDAAVGPTLRNGMSSINAERSGEIVLCYITLNSLFNGSAQTVLMTASFKVLKPGGAFTVFPETVGADDKDTTDVTEYCVVRGKTIVGEGRFTRSDKVAASEESGETGNPAELGEPGQAGNSAALGEPGETGNSAELGEPGQAGNSVKTERSEGPGGSERKPDKLGKAIKSGDSERTVDSDATETAQTAKAAKSSRSIDIGLWILLATLIIAGAVYIVFLKRKRVKLKKS